MLQSLLKCWVHIFHLKGKKIIRANRIFCDFIPACRQVNDFLIACSATTPRTWKDHNRVMSFWKKKKMNMYEQQKVKSPKWFSHNSKCLYRAVWKSKPVTSWGAVKCMCWNVCGSQPSRVLKPLKAWFYCKYFCTSINIYEKWAKIKVKVKKNKHSLLFVIKSLQVQSSPCFQRTVWVWSDQTDSGLAAISITFWLKSC